MKIKSLKINSDDQVVLKITGEVLRAFHIEVANEYEPIDFEKFEIVNSLKDNTIKTSLTVKNQTYSRDKIFTAQDKINPAEKRAAEIHRIIKKNLYKILIDNLNLEGVPYGIMHGVRPTKIIHRWLREGFGVTSHGVIDRDRIARRLVSDYLTSYDKSHLLTEVAVRQIPILNSGDDKTIGVYVGIPFCVTRCLYCSFPSNILPDEDKIAEFMSALTIDINAAAEEIQRYGFKVQSIYIGGGTPTALPSKFFVDMLNKVKAAFYSPSVEEFTVECGRPDTITPEKIFILKSCQVNRVSVNPQSMQQRTLDRIGRQHSVQQVYTAFNLLRKVGNFKINMDLILGLPGETLYDVQDSLEKVLALNPDDITLHALAIKRGSQLQTQIADEVSKIEDFELPDDVEVRKMAEVAEKMLRDQKYLPYYLYRQGYISGQIENIGYCKQGAECIYNIQIMDERQIILGVGAAATTKVPDNENMRMQTSFNAKDLTTYLRDVAKYIENRSKTLDEICNPKTKVEEKFSIDETVEENKPAEKTSRVKKLSRFERMKLRKENQAAEIETAEEIPPVEESETVEVVTDENKSAETINRVKKLSRFERMKLRKENTAAEIETAEEIPPVAESEIVEVETVEEKPVERINRFEKMSRFERMKLRKENKAAEEIPPVEKIPPVTESEIIETTTDEKINNVEEFKTADEIPAEESESVEIATDEYKAAEEFKTFEDVQPVVESESAATTENEEIKTVETEQAEKVELPENIHVSINTQDISNEEIFNEFLDEVAEIPEKETFEKPKTDEEIFDNFLEEVFESETVEKIQPVEEKTIEEIETFEDVQPVVESESVEVATDEETKPAEEIETFEDVQPVAEYESAATTENEEIKPAEEIETFEDVQPVVESEITEVAADEEIKPAEETETFEDVQPVVESESAEITTDEEIKPAEEIETFEDVQPVVESESAEIATDEEIKAAETINRVKKLSRFERMKLRTQNKAAEVETAEEIQPVHFQPIEDIKPLEEFKPLDDIKPIEDEFIEEVKPAEENEDETDTDDTDKTVTPRRPKFRHKRRRFR